MSFRISAASSALTFVEAHRGKIGIDATAPMKMRDVFRRRKFPGIETLNLDAILDPLRA